MDAGKYRSLLWELIAALDTGKFDHLSIEDVRLHARGGTISKFLKGTLGSVCDFSLLTPQDLSSLDEEFASMENAINARKKFGVENKGIALLMGWALQGVQDGT
ncbi:MAG TPA: hypothetical protein VHX92_02510 [Rhizomicrobium sp.]|jgi:hypothetical protein|nr:hypothetical protein [Rhizomicrobium sp.]